MTLETPSGVFASLTYGRSGPRFNEATGLSFDLRPSSPIDFLLGDDSNITSWAILGVGRLLEGGFHQGA